MSMAVLRLPGLKELPASAPKGIRAVMDTMMLTPAGVARWKRPPFQREIKINAKVLGAAEELKNNGGVISGIITLGKLGIDTYIVDGQHRLKAFELSELQEVIADVRIHTFDTMAEMGEEFARLNSQLVRFKVDDLLRGLEGTNEFLRRIRAKCSFVGYDNLRHASVAKPKLIAMSAILRVWIGSVNMPRLGVGAQQCVELLTDESTDQLIAFLTVCFDSWGYDKENFKLWGSLNVAICAWLYRRLVLRQGLPPHRRGGVDTVLLNHEHFRACLMALSANSQYVEWLRGRNMADRDRSPAYMRAKTIFQGRLGGMGYGRPYLPSPDWSTHS